MSADYDLVLERGKDGRLHLSKVEFHGLSDDTCKDRMAEIIEKLKDKGIVIDAKFYIPHQEVREGVTKKEVLGI